MKIKALKTKIKTKEIEEEIKEVINAPVEILEPEEFKLGDIIEDTSSGKRFHFHHQSVVMADKARFKKV